MAERRCIVQVLRNLLGNAPGTASHGPGLSICKVRVEANGEGSAPRARAPRPPGRAMATTA